MVITHAPLGHKQQAPTGGTEAHGLPEQEVPGPSHTEGDTHCDSFFTEQLVPAQQAPVGAQGSVPQVTPAPNQVPAQPAAVVIEQVSPTQHAPVGSAAQGLVGEQTVPAPFQVPPPPVQSD